MPRGIKEPWLSFLRDVDRALKGPAEVHCLGGFVLSALWDLPRPTGNVDFIEVRPSSMGEELLGIAGEHSELGERRHLHFQRVTVAEVPRGYEKRLVAVTPKALRRLRLRALEVHDLVLANLSRNSPRDRADVEFLAKKGALDIKVLKKRFEAELRPNLLNESRETLTLQLWLEEYLGSEA